MKEYGLNDKWRINILIKNGKEAARIYPEFSFKESEKEYIYKRLRFFYYEQIISVIEEDLVINGLMEEFNLLFFERGTSSAVLEIIEDSYYLGIHNGGGFKYPTYNLSAIIPATYTKTINFNDYFDNADNALDFIADKLPEYLINEKDEMLADKRSYILFCSDYAAAAISKTLDLSYKCGLQNSLKQRGYKEIELLPLFA